MAAEIAGLDGRVAAVLGEPHAAWSGLARLLPDAKQRALAVGIGAKRGHEHAFPRQFDPGLRRGQIARRTIKGGRQAGLAGFPGGRDQVRLARSIPGRPDAYREGGHLSDPLLEIGTPLVVVEIDEHGRLAGREIFRVTEQARMAEAHERRAPRTEPYTRARRIKHCHAAVETKHFVVRFFIYFLGVNGIEG